MIQVVCEYAGNSSAASCAAMSALAAVVHNAAEAPATAINHTPVTVAPATHPPPQGDTSPLCNSLLASYMPQDISICDDCFKTVHFCMTRQCYQLCVLSVIQFFIVTLRSLYELLPNAGLAACTSARGFRV